MIPGALPTADRVVTPDTFDKNLQGRTTSAYVGGSGGNVTSGSSAGGPGHGQTPVPQGDYTSNFDF